MSYIRINDLTKSFGEKKVLSGFSALLPTKGVTVIMGESGCGKTTLINIIMGLEKADSGEISGIPSRISAVFQEDCLCEEFSALSNLKAVTGKKVSRAEMIVYLERLGLTEADVTRPVRELSGGMKRRVAIARALVAEGDLVIMDEPFKGLDEEMRKKAINFVLNDTKKKARGLIVITHDPDEPQMLEADKFIFLERTIDN